MKKTALKIIAAIMLTVITVSGSISPLNFVMNSNAEPVNIICPPSGTDYGRCHLKHEMTNSWICVYSGYTTDFCAAPQNSNPN